MNQRNPGNSNIQNETYQTKLYNLIGESLNQIKKIVFNLKLYILIKHKIYKFLSYYLINEKNFSFYCLNICIIIIGIYQYWK